MSLAKIGQLAWRNLWRQRRRNLTMLVALSFAVMGVIFLNAFLRGMTAQMADGAINSMVGHVKVLQPGYRDDPGIARSFVLESEWSPEIPAGQLQGWARRVRVPAVIMSERETRGIEFIGIDPAQESISFVADWTIEGEGLQGPDDRRILVGKSLAEQLETAAGRRLVIVTQGADGRSREAGYRIAGLYQSEHSALEKFHVFTGIEAAQALLVSDTVTEVSVRLTDEKIPTDRAAEPNRNVRRPERIRLADVAAHGGHHDAALRCHDLHLVYHRHVGTCVRSGEHGGDRRHGALSRNRHAARVRYARRCGVAANRDRIDLDYDHGRCDRYRSGGWFVFGGCPTGLISRRFRRGWKRSDFHRIRWCRR
ncbi:MAG: hypothetical protein Ct9H300mP8_02320 [Gammaproteobacteria bacterium]|nr:MAG: hypothetical protein Ct9H300mP8_02320 [Gammaproteobacteria bacterium]